MLPAGGRPRPRRSGAPPRPAARPPPRDRPALRADLDQRHRLRPAPDLPRPPSGGRNHRLRPPRRPGTADRRAPGRRRARPAHARLPAAPPEPPRRVARGARDRRRVRPGPARRSAGYGRRPRPRRVPLVGAAPELPLAEGARALGEAIAASVRAHVGGHDRISCELSGGLDSTALTFAARATGPRRLSLLTVAARDRYSEDETWARRAVELAGQDDHPKPTAPDRHADEPTAAKPRIPVGPPQPTGPRTQVRRAPIGPRIPTWSTASSRPTTPRTSTPTWPPARPS